MAVLRKKAVKITKVCCIAENNQNLFLTVVDKANGMNIIEQSVLLDKEKEPNVQKILQQFVHSHGLQGEESVYVLPAAAYRLFLIDKPNVPETEIANAAKWLVRDLIDYPIEDAVIDTFEIPSSEQKAKMYLVVIKIALLEGIIKLLEESGLQVQKIAIAETALSTLLMQSIKDEAVALLYVDEKISRLMISKQGAIHMVRDIGEIDLSRQDHWDRLVQGVQRSFEFYQITLAGTRPVRFLLSPEVMKNEGLTKFLNEKLGVAVAALQTPEGLPKMGEEPTLIALSLMGETLQQVNGLIVTRDGK